METVTFTCDVCSAEILTTRSRPGGGATERAVPLSFHLNVSSKAGGLDYRVCSTACLRALADRIDAGSPPV